MEAAATLRSRGIDMVVIGVGVASDTRVAEAADLKVEKGVLVDGFLRTSDDSIFAAGDNARWPDYGTGDPIRVEHWVVAQRQGQTVTCNIPGSDERFRDVPFFWTRQFGTGISCVGHADAWDDVEVEIRRGGKTAFPYVKDGDLLALATIDRDRLSLEVETMLARPLSAEAPS